MTETRRPIRVRGIMTTKYLTTTHGTDGYTLLCPVCGEGDGLHHGKVFVFDRNGEFSDVTTVQNGLSATHRIPSDQLGNSKNGNGLIIEFGCEVCRSDNPRVLFIFRHEGQIFLKWESPEDQFSEDEE